MKISTLLRVIPVIFVLAAAAALVSMGVSISNERSYYNEERRINELGGDLWQAVEFLNEQARYYVESGDTKYFTAYMNEAYSVMTREKVISQIEVMGVSEEEIEVIKLAKEISHQLGELEEQAISQTRHGNSETGREILFSDEYKSLRESITDTSNQFQAMTKERCINKVNEAATRANIALGVLFAVVLGIIIAVFLFFHFVTGKIRGMTEMADIALKISQGDFDVDLARYESRDEFGMLAKSLLDILDTVAAIEGEIKQFVSDASGGNLVCRIEQERFRGSWSRILNGLNEALQNVRVQIIENAPVAYVVVVNDIITDCNRYATNQLGMVPGEPIEPHYENPSQRHRILRKLKDEGIVKSESASFVDVNGEARRYSMHLNVMRHEGKKTTILWAMDIEDEERKNDTIRRSQQDMRMVIDALPVAMSIEEPATGKVNYANPAFYKLIGVSPESGSVNEEELYAVEQADGVSAKFKDERLAAAINDTHGTAFEEFTYVSASGEKADVRVTAGEIMYNDAPSVIKVIQNIDEEKLKNKLLEDAAEHEREANQLKSRFLANMSHEIRTPMNAIIGFAQIALMRQQDTQNLDTFRKIHSSANNLLTIINDILDFSKIEAQKIDIIEDMFMLEDVVANAFLVASERIEDKRVEMLLDMQPDLPVKLVGDKTRLWQILKNLLDNSAKYTETGFIILRVSESSRDGEDRITLTFQVTDTGIGMTHEQVEELFMPFTQFSDNYKYKTSGTGLGMSITKELVELMGGSIKVTSEVGMGTKSTVSLSFRLSGDTATLADAISRDIPARFSVLIADDDPLACEIMARVLEAAGFEAVCVNTGDEAVAAAQSRETAGNPFNIIILDYILGKDNGIEVGRRISKDGSHSKLLMISAYVKKIPEEQIRDVGFKDVLQKPFVPSVFVKRLYDTLDERGMRALAGKSGFSGARVLLCEDNQLNQEIAVEMLKLMGIDPDVAEDGEQCISMLEMNEYDLILMDILMPVMDGLTATKKIRASQKAYSNVKIVAMTANVMREQVEEFAREGMDGHIPKPVDFDVLYDMLVRHLPPGTLREGGQLPGIIQNGGDGLPPDEIEAGFYIEGIELSDGLARFGGKEERYRSALLRFAEQETSYEKPEDSEEFHRYIHTIKGVAANLGINRVSELAKQVEADRHDNKPADASFAELAAELASVSKRIRAKVGAASKKKPGIVQAGTKDEYLECVSQLKQTVSTANVSDSERILRRLAATRWQDVPEHDYAQLVRALADYDFNLAEKLVELL